MSSPLRSMTGFGSGAVERDGISVRVELKSVNQRGLRINVRSRPSLGSLEKLLRDKISKELKRGQVDINIEITRLTPDPDSILNPGIAASAIHALRELKKQHDLAGEITMAEVVAVPGIFDLASNDSLSESEFAVVIAALEKGLGQLVEMRCAEGEATGRSIKSHADTIATFRTESELQAPLVIERTRERIEARLADLSPAAADQHALEREVTFFADRADIAEELDRLDSHIKQFIQTIDRGGEAGKRLEFLGQEMLREVNTMASKANDTKIASGAVEAKLAIEKIKEQAANIE